MSRLAAVLCAWALTACDAVRDVLEPPPVTVPIQNVVLQGTITGLGTRRPVVLQYNGQDTCIDTQATPNVPGVPCRFFGILGQDVSTFSFGSLPAGTPYEITVKAQPFGKICSVANGTGVLGSAEAAPAVACVNDPAVARYAVTVEITPEVAAIPSARVILTTEEDVFERSAAGVSRITFADVIFNSGTSLPVFRWSVTATSTEGNTVNNCNVVDGTNERLGPGGQDATEPPTGPVDSVQVTRCSFTVNATVAYQPAPGQPALAMSPGGMELALRRARTGEDERTLQVQDFSTAAIDDVLSNPDAIFELAVTRQPEGMACVVGSSSQHQWGSAVLLLDPLDANRTPSHGWVVSRNVRCRARPAQDVALRGTFRLHTLAADGLSEAATRNFLTFFDDGTYLYGHHAIGVLCTTTCGVEHGFYVYDPAARTISFNPVTDTNGASGLSVISGGVAIATPLTEVQYFAGPAARIEARFGMASWRLIEPPSVEGEMTGSWVTADHRRVWVFDGTSYNGFHAGVNGLGNAQDGCFNIEDVHAPQGFYTRRGNATTCELGQGYFTLDVPNALTVPRSPEGFVGKWPQATSQADGRPSSPVNYLITPGTPDQLRIRETVNGAETLDGVTPVSPQILLYRHRAR